MKIKDLRKLVRAGLSLFHSIKRSVGDLHPAIVILLFFTLFIVFLFTGSLNLISDIVGAFVALNVA